VFTEDEIKKLSADGEMMVEGYKVTTDDVKVCVCVCVCVCVWLCTPTLTRSSPVN